MFAICRLHVVQGLLHIPPSPCLGDSTTSIPRDKTAAHRSTAAYGNNCLSGYQDVFAATGWPKAATYGTRRGPRRRAGVGRCCARRFVIMRPLVDEGSFSATISTVCRLYEIHCLPGQISPAIRDIANEDSCSWHFRLVIFCENRLPK